VSAVYDKAAKQVVINVVNRHKTDAIATDIRSVTGAFTGPATVSELTSDDIGNTPYTYEARDTYPPKVKQVPASGSTFHFAFPAHSFTQIVVGVDR
jgi:alpha-N-arabinofuranosidase